MAEVNTMAKKKKRRSSGFNQQKIFKLVRMAALGIPAAGTLMSGATMDQKINQLKSDYFGVNELGQFELHRLGRGWTPFLASIGVTYGIPKLAGILRGL